LRSTSLNSLLFTRAQVAQGPCRLWQAAWLFLWVLFPLGLHALPNLAGVHIEQAPILGQPLDVRVEIAGTTEWRVSARAEESATNFIGATWRRIESETDSSRRYVWSSDALVEDPVLRLVLVNTADPSDRQVLTLLPELPLAGLSMPAVDARGSSVGGSVAAGAPASLSDRRVMPRLELLQPQAGEQLRDSERMRLLQLETEALLLRESLAAFEDEQARLRVRVQEAEAIALASEQRLREAGEEVERLRDMLYARDAALESLRDKVWMTLIIGLILLLLVVLGFVLWWRSELPDRKLREEARARLQWRTEHEPSPQPVEPLPAAAPLVTEVAPEPVSTPEPSSEPMPEPTPTPEPIPSAPVAGVDPFMLDMVRAHLDLGDVAAADATLQVLEQTAADDPQVVALRAQIQQQRSNPEAGH
jgi:hypothetical protein